LALPTEASDEPIAKLMGLAAGASGAAVAEGYAIEASSVVAWGVA